MGVPIARQYIKDFEQLGFGVFIHFGLYSIIGKGEWAADQRGDIDEEYYKGLVNEFEVDNLDSLVKDIKNAGAKYITFTTRHHDGFSLYDTKGLSTFDVMHSKAGRDLVKEFVDACHKYDIVPFFYHTTLEWYNDDFKNNFSKYLEYLRESVKILCTNYGKIGGLWFDGNWSKEGDVWEEDKLYALIRQYQPDAMIINNTGLQCLGAGSSYLEIDSVTFERGKAFPQNREGKEKYVAAEVCDSINNHWGIAEDFNFKSPKTILEALCRSRAAGANYLFNVGPDAKGNIPPFEAATLDLIGRWMNYYGEAIYNGRPCWFRENEKNCILKDDKHIYLFCFDLAQRGSDDVIMINGKEGKFTFEDFELSVDNIRWMDNQEKIKFSFENNNLTVNFTGYDYGTDYCVRVAIGDIKN